MRATGCHWPPALRRVGQALLVGLLLLPFVVLGDAMVRRGGDPGAAPLASAWRSEALALLPRTIGLALGAASVAAAVGVVVGSLLALRRWPLARAIELLSLAPLLLPPAFQVAVLERLASADGLLPWLLSGRAAPGQPLPIRHLASAVLVLGLSQAPISILLTAMGLRAVPRSRLQAAALARGPATAWLRVALPLAAPAMAVGVSLVFTLTLLNYEVPRLLDVQTYAVWIQVSYGADDDPGLAFAAALPLFVVAAAPLVASLGWSARRRFALGGLEDAGAALPPPRAGICGWVTLLAWLGVSLVLPTMLLVKLAGPLSTYARAWQTEWDRILATTLHVGAVGGLCALVSGLLLLPPWRTRLVGPWLWVALALPGSLLGFACVRLGQSALFFPLYNSAGMLLYAHVTRFLPVACFALDARLRGMPAGPWAAAELVPGEPRRWWRVRLPLAAPGLTAGAVAAAVLASGELQSTLLLAQPGATPVIVQIFNLLHYHPERDALAALCLFHAASVFAAVAALGGAGWLLGAILPGSGCRASAPRPEPAQEQGSRGLISAPSPGSRRVP